MSSWNFAGDQPIHPSDLEAFVHTALERVGLSPDDAATTAEALTLADTMGVHTHGTKLLAGYIRKLQGGGYRAKGAPKILREGPGWAVVDGDSALGQVGSTFATDLAINKAKTVGIAYVGLKNTGHIGAAGYYAWRAARQGLFGMVVGNDIPSVAAPGSRGAVLGSNPLAWAAPVPDADPILLDMATAAVAGGKVYAARQRGESIPPTWLIGPDGLPTTDGTLYPQQASLAPMAGHKGYGLGLLAELLSGVLPGGAITWQVGSWMFDPPSQPSLHNAGFIVADIPAIADPHEYRQAMTCLANEIRQTPPATGVDRVLLPGDREWSLRATALEDGIRMPADVREKLAEASQLAGVT